MSTGKKNTGRRSRKNETEHEGIPEPNLSHSMENEGTVVTDWSKESKKDRAEEESSDFSEENQMESKKSVLDFDREEMKTFENRKVTELSEEDLFKILICRGEEKKNPIISGGCERLLKQINREKISRPRQPERNSSSIRPPPMRRNFRNYRNYGNHGNYENHRNNSTSGSFENYGNYGNYGNYDKKMRERRMDMEGEQDVESELYHEENFSGISGRVERPRRFNKYNKEDRNRNKRPPNGRKQYTRTESSVNNA